MKSKKFLLTVKKIPRNKFNLLLDVAPFSGNNTTYRTLHEIIKGSEHEDSLVL